MLNSAKFGGLLVVAASLILGCAESDGPVARQGAATTPDATYLLTTKPTEVRGVAQACQECENDELIAVEGRIGGVKKPFVDGIAAFTLIDTKLNWCADSEGSATPWDYCCSDKTGKLAAVTIIGSDDQPVAKNARELLGVKELSKVVVHGAAKRDDQGNLTILAKKVYVAQD